MYNQKSEKQVRIAWCKFRETFSKFAKSKLFTYLNSDFFPFTILSLYLANLPIQFFFPRNSKHEITILNYFFFYPVLEMSFQIYKPLLWGKKIIKVSIYYNFTEKSNSSTFCF